MRRYSESERWDEESRSLSAPSACLVSLVGAKIAYEHHRFLLTELTDIRGGGKCYFSALLMCKCMKHVKDDITTLLLFKEI